MIYIWHFSKNKEDRNTKKKPQNRIEQNIVTFSVTHKIYLMAKMLSFSFVSFSKVVLGLWQLHCPIYIYMTNAHWRHLCILHIYIRYIKILDICCKDKSAVFLHIFCFVIFFSSILSAIRKKQCWKKWRNRVSFCRLLPKTKYVWT